MAMFPFKLDLVLDLGHSSLHILQCNQETISWHIPQTEMYMYTFHGSGQSRRAFSVFFNDTSTQMNTLAVTGKPVTFRLRTVSLTPRTGLLKLTSIHTSSSQTWHALLNPVSDKQSKEQRPSAEEENGHSPFVYTAVQRKVCAVNSRPIAKNYSQASQPTTALLKTFGQSVRLQQTLFPPKKLLRSSTPLHHDQKPQSVRNTEADVNHGVSVPQEEVLFFNLFIFISLSL